MKYTGRNTVRMILAMLLIPLGSLTAGTLVNDTFESANRTTQNLPDSMAWYSGASSADLTVRGSQMTFTTSGAGRTILAYFGKNPAGTTGISLEVGDSIAVHVTFTAIGEILDVNNSLRIGLFNSSTSEATPQRISSDNFGNENDVFKGYTGYAVFINPGIAGNLALRLFERSNAGSAALLTTFDDFTEGGRAAVRSPLETGTTYNAELIAKRTAEDIIDITFSITGGSFTDGDYTITHSFSRATHTFDTLAFASVSNQMLDYNFESIKITVDTQKDYR